MMAQQQSPQMMAQTQNFQMQPQGMQQFASNFAQTGAQPMQMTGMN